MINDLWYKNAIIYCLSVGTFMDANGDGIGDFAGLERRLDYIQGLGATAVWLMPFQPSPKKDGGYDIADYYGVDPDYGSLGDFVAFTHAAKQRGLRVLIDLVVNHTSDQHPWFQSARSDPDSPYRDWYVWSKERPASADEGMVFPGVQETTWTYDAKAKAWYFHRFFNFQPDLNTANPEVLAEILKIMGFWIQLASQASAWMPCRSSSPRRGPMSAASPASSSRCCATCASSCNGARRRHHPGRGQHPAEPGHGLFRRRRRPHAHDVQLPGQSGDLLRPCGP